MRVCSINHKSAASDIDLLLNTVYLERAIYWLPHRDPGQIRSICNSIANVHINVPID